MEERILIVDDEEVICNVLARRLGKEGYSSTTANDGKEALNHFYKGNFSLIISDINMPEMNGIELLQKVKAIDPKVKMIMVTAYPEIDLAVNAMRLGAYDFIIKPADLDLIIMSVKKALESKRLEEEIEAYHNRLEEMVEERTAKLQQAYRFLKKSYLDSVKVLTEAIDAKDPYTRGHSDRVKRMSLAIAKQMGFSEERLENLEYGALLHDIGKIGIKDEILQKQGPLSNEEYHYIQEHPLIGVKIVEGVEFFREKLPMIRNHHEYYDGSGYPDGLAGESIPLEARIITLPDAFDAMTSARPHRGMMPLQEVLEELEKCRGKQFDPKVVEIFIREKIYKL
jgi:putative nucleotidyltransferase with HDIG domain